MFKKQKAFTLIELLTTLVVLGVVVGVAVPSFNSQILNSKSVALGEDFVSALSLVRSEAVKRANRVSICASTDGLTCSGVATDWTKGFIAVVDYATTDSAAAPELTDSTHPTSTVIRAWDKQDIKAEFSVKRDTTPISFIRYTQLGTLARIGSTAITVDAEMRNCKGDARRVITVGVAGLVGVERKTCKVY
jgi:type IV fimbrial biogenesis protein FimT